MRKFVPIILVLLMYACTTRSNAEIGTQATEQLRDAVLCDCLYQVKNYTLEERTTDGTMGAIVEVGSFSIEELQYETKRTTHFLDTSQFNSKNGSTLNIMKCLVRMDLYDLD